MTWTNVSFPYASQLTAAKMGQLQANFAAIANADSGAPSVVTAALANAVVTQSKLSTTTASGSTTGTTYALTGGTYSWWTAGTSGELAGGGALGGGDTAAGVIGVVGGSGSTLYIDERYIQASPPYNLGNGDIPLFVFVELNKLGELEGVSLAEDPPWAYHGPTDIRADRYDKVSGRAFRVEKFINGKLAKNFSANDLLKLPNLDISYQEIEITYEWKNFDIHLMPHVFPSTEHLVGMLDPHSKLGVRLLDELIKNGAVAARHLALSSKFFIMEKSFITPPGVIALQGVLP